LANDSLKKPAFPFIALLVSGGHTQLMHVQQIGDYQLLGETVDDAAGEAFDKTAKLLGLDYPGGAALSQLAESGKAAGFDLPRPMLHSKDLDFSFSGLKTAVLHQVKKAQSNDSYTASFRANLACAFVEAVTDVLSHKAMAALEQMECRDLVVAGGVGANTQLRKKLTTMATTRGYRVHYPPIELCTDNGVMIAFAGALRLLQSDLTSTIGVFDIKPRWDLSDLNPKAS
jgi:N6-L-threonylcarbamoyladenine synthase